MAPVAFSIARRELRGGFSRFGVFLACLALGVGLVAVVGSLAAAVDASIRRDAKALLGGDVSIRQSMSPHAEAALEFARNRGRISRQALLRVMASAPGADPVLAELKAVDAAYPLYGSVRLAPDMPLQAALAETGGLYGAVCEPGLLARLGLALGDTVRVGTGRFELRAVLEREPDRAVSVFTLGPRLMVSLKGLGQTGLLAPGALVRHKLLVRLDPGLDPAAFTADLEQAFPQAPWRVRDASDAGPRLKRFVTRMELYLTFVGLTAVLIGGLGMAQAVSSYLDSRAASIAALKCVGATGPLVLAAYLLQVMALAAVGTIIGLLAGAAAPWLAADVLSRFLPAPLDPAVHFAPLLSAAGLGLLAALVFCLGPLISASRVPGAALFRGYVQPGREGAGRDKWYVALAASVLAAYVVATSSDKALALVFCGGVLAAFGFFALLAALIRSLARRIRPRNRPRLRLALFALHRPGNATTQVIFALGLGLTVLVAVAQIDANFRRQVSLVLPGKAPAYYFIDIQDHQLDDFQRIVSGIEGVDEVRTSPMLRGRIRRIDGAPVSEVDIPEDKKWAVRSDRGLTYAADMPEGTEIVAGAWWPEHYSGPPRISLTEDLAEAFGVGVGDTLTINVLGRDVTAEIASLRRVDWRSLSMNFALIFAPGYLEQAPMTHIATVNAPPEAEAGIIRAVARALPNVTGIRVREVLESVGGLLSSISLAVGAVAGVTLAAGLLVLASALRATARRRIFEAVVLKVVGAANPDVLASLLAEYALLGTLAGACAAGLGTLAAYLVVVLGLDFDWVFAPLPAGATLAAALAVTLAFGLSGIRHVLTRRPAEYLRNE